MTKFYARLRTPAQETRLKVAPASKGIRLEFGDRFLYLNEHLAYDLANAITDCIEATKETP